MGPIIFDLQSTLLTDEEKEILRHPAIGGVIFFSRNFESGEQIFEIAREIKSIRPDCLLTVDQEGGRVQRFKKGFTTLPCLQKLGELINQGKTLAQVQAISESLGYLMALEIRSVGLDLSFAPVLDLGKGISEVIQDRAFHHDPQMIADLATAYIQGMRKAGMAATGKHFPGHGSVVLDSHLTLPVDNRRFEDLTMDLLPFRELIQQNIEAMMPAHILYPEIDAFPVGFSKYWLKNILREQLGFQGAIISDDLSMAGAYVMGDYSERADKAMDAGCDLILVCNNRDGVISILENVTISHSPLSEKRRMSLLAKGEKLIWRTLQQNNKWQSAVEGLNKLCLN